MAIAGGELSGLSSSATSTAIAAAAELAGVVLLVERELGDQHRAIAGVSAVVQYLLEGGALLRRAAEIERHRAHGDRGHVKRREQLLYLRARQPPEQEPDHRQWHDRGVRSDADEHEPMARPLAYEGDVGTGRRLGLRWWR